MREASRDRGSGSRIIKARTARSQLIGGAVMAIGMALHEETVLDHRLGRCMSHHFADCHMPVDADIPEIEVIFMNEPDTAGSLRGVEGVGGIGVAGTAAAVAGQGGRAAWIGAAGDAR